MYSLFSTILVRILFSDLRACSAASPRGFRPSRISVGYWRIIFRFPCLSWLFPIPEAILSQRVLWIWQQWALGAFSLYGEDQYDGLGQCHKAGCIQLSGECHLFCFYSFHSFLLGFCKRGCFEYSHLHFWLIRYSFTTSVSLVCFKTVDLIKEISLRSSPVSLFGSLLSALCFCIVLFDIKFTLL